MAPRTTTPKTTKPAETKAPVKRTRRVTKPKVEAPVAPAATDPMEATLGALFQSLKERALEEARAEVASESPTASLALINKAADKLNKLTDRTEEVGKALKSAVSEKNSKGEELAVLMGDMLDVFQDRIGIVADSLSQTSKTMQALELLKVDQPDEVISPVAPVADEVSNERMINLISRMERRLTELDAKDLEQQTSKPKTHYYSVNAESTLTMTQQELNRLMRANWIVDKLTTYLIHNREPFLEFIRSDYVSGTAIRQIQIVVPGKAGTRTHMQHAAITICNANISNSRWTMGVRGTYRQYSRDCEMKPIEIDTILSALEAHIPDVESADRTVRTYSSAP